MKDIEIENRCIKNDISFIAKKLGLNDTDI